MAQAPAVLAVILLLIAMHRIYGTAAVVVRRELGDYRKRRQEQLEARAKLEAAMKQSNPDQIGASAVNIQKSIKMEGDGTSGAAKEDEQINKVSLLSIRLINNFEYSIIRLIRLEIKAMCR